MFLTFYEHCLSCYYQHIYTQYTLLLLAENMARCPNLRLLCGQQVDLCCVLTFTELIGPLLTLVGLVYCIQTYPNVHNHDNVGGASS